MRKRRIAAAHASSILLDRAASVAKAAGIVDQAAAEGVELICFPETFVPGFPYWINLYPPTDQHRAHVRYIEESVDLSGDDLRPVCEAAARGNVFVVLGISERDGGTAYNCQVFIDGTGRIVGKHRKLQPTFAERTIWGQGDGSTLNVFDTAVGRVSGLICYEHMMNLAREAMIVQRAEIHCASWPTFTTSVRRETYDRNVDTLMRAHALTGQCFVILAENPVTEQYLQAMEEAVGPQDLVWAGGGYSAIYGPNGNTLAGPHLGPEETIVWADIDLDDILPAKLMVDTLGHYARPEVLSLNLNRKRLSVLHEENGRSERDNQT